MTVFLMVRAWSITHLEQKSRSNESGSIQNVSQPFWSLQVQKHVVNSIPWREAKAWNEIIEVQNEHMDQKAYVAALANLA